MPSNGESAPGFGRDQWQDGEPQADNVERTPGAVLARIDRGLARWGDAFLAYLQLADTDVRAPNIESQFVDAYAGYYDCREALVDAQLDSLGWTKALTDFKAENGINDDDLDWNDDVLWIRCCEVYTVNERLGGVHAFFL